MLLQWQPKELRDYWIDTWYDKDIEVQVDNKDKAHDRAEITNDQDDWRHFWRQRNKYNNDIKTAKKKYYY